jgi:hypothetical protein
LEIILLELKGKIVTLIITCILIICSEGLL